MSINYCTIGTLTVDGFCGTQRAKVLARLIDIAHPPVVNPPVPPWQSGGSIASGNMPNYGYTNPWYDPSQSNTDNVVDFEQPYITVTVSDFFGDKGSETLSTSAKLDFVTVTNLEFETEDSISDEITVNISGLEI